MKNNKRKITKAVITCAGYGTRFLPATKNQPKEMLPIIDKPIIHHLVQEAVDSGIKDIIIVTRAGFHILEDYFDTHFEIEEMLKKTGKDDYYKIVREIPGMANFIYVRQHKLYPYGNGSPLMAAKSVIDDDEAIVYMFGDDLTLSKKPVVKQLIDVYEKYEPAAVIGAQEVSDDLVHKYGIFDYLEDSNVPNQVKGVIEKPKLEEKPSNMAQFGRFILSPMVIKELFDTPTGKGNELWLTDAIDRVAKKGGVVIGQPIEGEWLTTGDPLNYLKATLKYAMKRKDLKDGLKEFIKEMKS
ncbi:UTP--glucose-1-phosphate uridylyltransferase [Patescibacteria group bacterium]